MRLAPRWLTLAVAMVGYALVQMGLVPVNLIMPTLSHDLGVPLRVASWLVTGNLLVMTALVLPAGRLGDVFGHKRVFLWGLGTYTLASIWCGLSSSFWMLMTARLAQGIAAAFINGTAMAWVTNAFPAAWRGRVVGTLTLSSFIGGFTSSYLGPLSLQAGNWHWVFWVLVPPGILACLLGATIPEERPVRSGERRSLDWAGVTVLGLALITFSLGLNHMHSGAESFADGWSWHLPMDALTVSLLALFVAIERRVKDPIIPLRYFRNRAFVAALGANIILHLTMMANSAIAPFLVQSGLGLTPQHTGNLMMMLQVLSLVMSPISGWLYDKADSRLMLPGAMVIIGSGFFMYGLWNSTLSFTAVAVIGIYLGTGMGLFLSANNAALMSAAPREARGFASGMMETTRQLGHGVATAMVGTILSHGVSLGATEAGRSALTAGFRSAYWVMTALAAAGLVCAIWYGLERQRGAAPVAAD